MQTNRPGLGGERGPGLESRTIKLYMLYIEKLQSKGGGFLSEVLSVYWGAPSAAGTTHPRRRCEGDRRRWECRAEYGFWTEATEGADQTDRQTDRQLKSQTRLTGNDSADWLLGTATRLLGLLRHQEALRHTQLLT